MNRNQESKEPRAEWDVNSRHPVNGCAEHLQPVLPSYTRDSTAQERQSRAQQVPDYSHDPISDFP